VFVLPAAPDKTLCFLISIHSTLSTTAQFLDVFICRVAAMSTTAKTAPPDPVDASASTTQLGHESDDGDVLLAAMGYKAELVRTRSTWHVAFMSFVLASIPYGLATTLYYPLQGGGPAVVVWGWLLVSLIILCVAASLGEITSVYPTAGGVYYQTFMLAPARLRRAAAYICGWAYVVGNITITLAVQFGTTLFFVACVNVFEREPDVGIWEASTYQVFLTFLGITLLCNAISIFGNRWLHILDVSFIFGTFRKIRLLTHTVRRLPFSGPLRA
jgi:amino acid permease